MKGTSNIVARASEKVSSDWFDHAGILGWKDHNEFYMVLKARTEGETRQVMMGRGEDNCWEA